MEVNALPSLIVMQTDRRSIMKQIKDRLFFVNLLQLGTTRFFGINLGYLILIGKIQKNS